MQPVHCFQLVDRCFYSRKCVCSCIAAVSAGEDRFDILRCSLLSLYRDLLALPAIPEPEVAKGTPADSSSSSFAQSASDSSSIDQDAPEPASAGASGSHCRAVVHLMVHKSAKVNW
jgi:hypothetical protein